MNLTVSLPANFALIGELWADWNFDPAGTVRQRSADVALTYAVSASVQLDAGVNIGLNRATPGAQTYVGVSQRF